MKLSCIKLLQPITAITFVLAFCTSIVAAPSYKAAGILPYSFNEQGKIVVLLGLSSAHRNEATDFGGQKDFEDHENPHVTAAREGCEELFFIFDNDSAFKNLVLLQKKHGKNFDLAKAHSTSYDMFLKKLKHCPSIQNNGYVMNFINIDYNKQLPKLFAQRKLAYHWKVPFCWDETTQIVWIELDKIYDAIDTRANKSVCIHGIYLYEPFVDSLVLARFTGVLPSLQ